ncbi:hypothetical protein KI387_004997, partial [Taxus chinensis]
FYKNITADRILLNKSLKKNAPTWSNEMTSAVQRIKNQVLDLPPMSLPGSGIKIIECDASDQYWGAVLKEKGKDIQREDMQ